MSEELNKLTQRFVVEKERFFVGCDAQEEQEKWNLEEYGQMDVYYESVLVSTLLRMIVKDGKVSEKETAFLKEAFELDYPADELQAIADGFTPYENNQAFCENLKADLSLIDGANAQLAVLFREMMGLACRIILAADTVDEAEKALAEEILAVL